MINAKDVPEARLLLAALFMHAELSGPSVATNREAPLLVAGALSLADLLLKQAQEFK